MSPITNCIKNKDTKTNPIWLMRQAGRYLPEFRNIRKENQDFIKLCLNSDLASEITLQPIKRFGFDGAVIFSDILMLPYGLGQKVEFEKNFGPKLGKIKLGFSFLISLNSGRYLPACLINHIGLILVLLFIKHSFIGVIYNKLIIFRFIISMNCR